MSRGAFHLSIAVGILLSCSSASATVIVDYHVHRWTSGPGADGRTYAIVIAAEPWSWRDARAIATEVGASLAATPDSNALMFAMSIATGSGAFDCAGPWLGGYHFGGSGWQWTNNATFVPFAWAPSRPAQSIMLDSAICLGGTDAPDGTWIDSLAGPDAGLATRSAIMVWNVTTDCDANGAPDQLQIAVNPSLDADNNGALDSCPAIGPADLDGNGRVDGADLALLLSNYNGSGIGDINHDGIVNGPDLGLLLSAWTYS
jgi:hypothetical protein